MRVVILSRSIQEQEQVAMEDEETRQYWQAFIAESERAEQELMEQLLAMEDEVNALFSALLIEQEQCQASR